MKIKDGVLIGINKEKDIKCGKCVIPSSVTSIGTYAFGGCSGLTSIEIPNSVTSIRQYAFSYCSSLTSIVLPNGVTSIEDGAFRNCSSLTSVTIGNGVTSIGSCAFLCCSSLTSIVLPDGVTSIGDGAFAECHSLTSISVSENNANYKSVDGNLYSKDGKTLIRYAIGKTNTTFTIPNSVTSIGYAVFSDCNNLTSIEIPDSVTRIGDSAFLGCSSLTSIVLPDSVTSIGSGAFSGCSSLKNVTIGNSVTSIGEYAFEDCKNLITSKPSAGYKGVIKAVKGLSNKDGELKCRDFIYQPGVEYTTTEAKLCECGYHACLNGLDVFNYYAGGNVVYYEVELSDISDERSEDSKVCGKRIKLIKQLTAAEAANYRSDALKKGIQGDSECEEYVKTE